jgi:phytoene desaturase
MSHGVVIGGGFAGLAAAASLAIRGHRVTLLEAAADVGGKAAAVERAGASVDLGPTLLTDVEPLRRLFAAAGIGLEDVVPVERLDPGFVAAFPDGRRLPLHRDPAAFDEALMRLGPAAKDDWRRVLDLGARAARLTAHYYARGDVATPGDLAAFLFGGGARPDDVARFARHRSLAALLAAHVRTPELVRLLAHCARFLGLDADRAPSAALVIPYLFATVGVMYPMGGCAALARAMRDLAIKHGAHVETGVPVTHLDVRRGAFVAAVMADGRRIRGDGCVTAVDIAQSERWLDRAAPRASRGATYAARVAWWVVEGRPRQDAHHTFYFGDADAHPLYVAVPTITDRTLAPAGVSILYSLVHGGPGATADAHFADAMRVRLVRATAWPGGRVLAQGVAGGAESCYGAAIGPGLFASFRAPQRVRGVANVLRAGASVFPGPGVSNVVRSGLRAAALLDERLRR